MLITAAILLILIGFIHSYLGERFILIRLFKKNNLPKLFGDDSFTKKTLRFAWHLTSIAWFGFAAILIYLSMPEVINQEIIDQKIILLIIATVFLIHTLIAFIFSNGKHLSWIPFSIITACCFYVAMYN